MPSESSEKVEIHLRDGGVIYTTVQADDPEFIENAVEGAPGWVWIGDAFVHNRAVSAIAYLDESYLPAAEIVGLELAEEPAQ